MDFTEREGILNHIQYFMTELLGAAKTRIGWKENDIKDARQWATYCNKFSIKMQELGIFDACVQVLAQRMNGMDVEKISTILRDPIKAFNRAFLMNSSLDKVAFGELLNINLAEQSETSFYEVFYQTVHDQNIVAELMSTPMVTSPETDEFQENLRRQLIIAQLTEAFSENERFINDYINVSFASTNQLLPQMLGNTILLSTSLDNDCKSSDCFKSAMIKLIDKCASDGKSRHKLLNDENTYVLAQLALRSELFYAFYTNALKEECDLLSRPYKNNVDSTWIHSPGHLSFVQLTKHWTELMNTKQSIAITTVEMIEGLVINSDNLVWLDILRIGSKSST